MTSTVIDRFGGVTASLAVKVPARAATTAPIALEGEQTVDGVALTEGDRALVKDQANAVENGIYTVSTGLWTRAKDFDGARDVVTGTLVLVNSGGTANGGTAWEVATAGTIAIGTSLVSFSRSLSADLPVPANPGDNGKVLAASGGSVVWSTLASLGVALLNVTNTFTSGLTLASSVTLARRASGNTPSNVMNTDYFNAAGTRVANEFATGDQSSGTIWRRFSLGLFQWHTGETGIIPGSPKMTLANNGGLFMKGATGGSQGEGTGNFTALYKNGTEVEMLISESAGPTTGTTQSTTSGTSKTFDSIPAGTTRITVLIDVVQLNGTDNLLVQIGDSGGVETGSYVSLSTLSNAGGSGIATSTDGFIMIINDSAGVLTARMMLHHIGSNRWISDHTGRTVASSSISGGGDKTLSAELTTVLIKPTGSNSFGAGQATIIYE